MVKNGGNKVTIVRSELNSLSFPNGLAELLGESFLNCKWDQPSKLLVDQLTGENAQRGWNAQD